MIADPVPIARTLRHDRKQSAAALLRGHAEVHGLENDEVLDLLVGLFPFIRDDAAFALGVMKALEARDGPTVVSSYRIGGLHAALGDHDEVLDYARVLEELGAPATMRGSYEKRFVQPLEPRSSDR